MTKLLYYTIYLAIIIFIYEAQWVRNFHTLSLLSCHGDINACRVGPRIFIEDGLEFVFSADVAMEVCVSLSGVVCAF